MSNPIRLCMIGAGQHASRIIYSCFPYLQNAVVVANSDLEETRAREIGRRYGITACYTDYRAMLAQEQPDGVIICVGADFHARTAIELMEAGFHVYTEKAPALDLNQCGEMLSTQRRTGKVCMTAFKKRFAPAYVKSRRVIQSETFGAPDLLTITRTSGKWHGSEDTINTYLRENSIHVVDLAAYLFGPVKSVSATGRGVATAALNLEFANGAIGNVSVTDRMSYTRGWEVVTAVGTGGVCIQVDNSVEMNAFKLDEPIAAHKPEFVSGNSLSIAEQGFLGELQEFVNAIQTGQEPEAHVTHAFHAMAILKAVRQSLETRSTVEVEPTP